jgi:hypothetical protein
MLGRVQRSGNPRCVDAVAMQGVRCDGVHDRRGGQCVLWHVEFDEVDDFPGKAAAQVTHDLVGDSDRYQTQGDGPEGQAFT